MAVLARMRVWTAIALAAGIIAGWAGASTVARGTVYHDRDRNGVFDAGEQGVPGVCVSNGRDVTRTDGQGRWTLPVNDDTILFVVKPAGWGVPVDKDNLPRFHYIHKPQGSPPLDPPGVEPTGPLPASIDFPLYVRREPRRFQAIFFADPQARGMREVNFIAHDVVEELIGSDAAFGVTLGDIVADDVGLFDAINGAVGRIGIPWYSVFGNHDTNRDARDDRYSDETFERVYGPPTYAFEYADVAFIALDSVYVKSEGGYEGRFTADQLTFVRNYLSTVPMDRLVVLMMHIPLHRCRNGRELLALLADRPHTFSISGHAHEQSHHFLGEEYGWSQPEPHHHLVNAAVSGSWWCGVFDELGIPHATMNDGAPNGYSIVDFDGNRYSIRFKAARRPADYQMNIYLPDEVESAETGSVEAWVNVFAGSERSRVEMRVGDEGEWIPLERTPERDPACQRMYEQTADISVELEERFGWKMDPPSVSSHIWKGTLPDRLPEGTHGVTVRTRDMFGQEYTAHRILRVI